MSDTPGQHLLVLQAARTFSFTARRAGTIAASTPAAIATTVNAARLGTETANETPKRPSAFVTAAASSTPTGRPRPAPTHRSSVGRKLEISSRSQLPAALAATEA